MFAFLGITLVAAVAAGFAFGGRIGRLADLRFAMLPMLYGALGLGLLPLFVNMSTGTNRVLTGIANLLVLIFLAVNLSRHGGLVRWGLVVLLAGWLLNAVVIAANKGMPLSEWAYAQSGQTDPITEGEGGFFKIVVADVRTNLPFLGDVIPIKPLRQVLSAGDLLLMAGIGLTVIGGMRRQEYE